MMLADSLSLEFAAEKLNYIQYFHVRHIKDFAVT